MKFKFDTSSGFLDESHTKCAFCSWVSTAQPTATSTSLARLAVNLKIAGLLACCVLHTVVAGGCCSLEVWSWVLDMGWEKEDRAWRRQRRRQRQRQRLAGQLCGECVYVCVPLMLPVGLHTYCLCHHTHIYRVDQKNRRVIRSIGALRTKTNLKKNYINLGILRRNLV